LTSASPTPRLAPVIKTVFSAIFITFSLRDVGLIELPCLN
jgi:hypothetical protein